MLDKRSEKPVNYTKANMKSQQGFSYESTEEPQKGF